ncbi:MAG TPA: hypothetical protein VFW33_19855 [Gemmataceae bacterium]|nr:hypothetical protein [Gemmataceae bacterium]
MKGASPARRPRKWVWFFLLLGTLAAAGIVIEVWSNVQQQLTPEKLAVARALWAQNGPRDYELDYEVKRDETPDPSPRVGEKYTVRVKDGKAEPRPSGEFGGMDELFDWIADRLARDAADHTRPFVKGTFDRHDGHVLHYVRSVMTTRERVEITVTLRPLTSS